MIHSYYTAALSRGLHVAARARAHVVLCALAAAWGWSRLLHVPVLAEDFAVVPLAMVSIYTWNRVTDQKEDAVNDPRGALLVAGHHRRMLATSVAAAGAAVALSLVRGERAAVGCLLLVLALGVAYSTPLRGRLLRGRLKDVFVVKNLVSCIGWAVLTILYPLVHTGATVELSHVVAVCVMFAAVWSVEIVWDIRDREGDRAAGIPTIPVRCGVAASRWCIVVISSAGASLILAAIAGDVLGAVWLFVLTSPVLSVLWVLPMRAPPESRRAPSHVLVALQTLLLISLGILADTLPGA